MYVGPPIDDPEMLERLPSEYRSLLAQANGYVAFHGGLHVRGACLIPEWHSLRAASGWRARRPSALAGGIARQCSGRPRRVRRPVRPARWPSAPPCGRDGRTRVARRRPRRVRRSRPRRSGRVPESRTVGGLPRRRRYAATGSVAQRLPAVLCRRRRCPSLVSRHRRRRPTCIPIVARSTTPRSSGRHRSEVRHPTTCQLTFVGAAKQSVEAATPQW